MQLGAKQFQGAERRAADLVSEFTKQGMEKAEAAEQGQYMRGRERNDRQRTGRVRSGSGSSISMELPGLSSQEVRGPIKNHLWLFTKLERAASMCELALVEFID